TDSATALPSGNARPTVSIISPTLESLFVGPITISVLAQAIDSDGSVTRVDFYDGNTLIGSGSQTSTPNQYGLDWNNIGFGIHTLRAVATDNGGKAGVSNSVTVMVNGPATVNITSPVGGTVFTPGSTVNINATAVNSSGSIAKVQFVTDGLIIGDGVFGGKHTYAISWTG